MACISNAWSASLAPLTNRISWSTNFPAAGTSIKEKSIIKIFVSPELAQVIVPEMAQMGLREAEDC